MGTHHTEHNGEPDSPDACVKKAVGKALAQTRIQWYLRMRKSTDCQIEKCPHKPANKQNRAQIKQKAAKPVAAALYEPGNFQSVKVCCPQAQQQVF